MTSISLKLKNSNSVVKAYCSRVQIELFNATCFEENSPLFADVDLIGSIFMYISTKNDLII